MNSSDSHHRYGQWGEDRAASYLRQQRLRLVARHYQTRYGEIDLVVRDGDTLVFVEVKTRQREYNPSAADAVTPSKQRKIVGAALSFLKHYGYSEDNIRFDVILIEGPRLQWLRGAFEVDSYFTR